LKTIPIIEFKNINKKFGDFFANEEISFEITSNTVHSLIGENGAGKTTLMKILFGIYKQDSGQIFINGKTVSFDNPLDAIKNNIGMVHQHFELIDDFTALENIVLGDEESDYGFLNLSKSRKVLIDLIAKYNLGISLDEKVSNISISEKQKIELLKLLYRKSEILIFDEPTAVLSPIEVEEFFKIIRKFKDEGKTILLITHKLNEIKELADKVTVLRKGKVVYEVDSSNLDLSLLSKEIVGELESVIDLNVRECVSSLEPFIELQDVVFAHGNASVLNGINLSVFGGQIYSICGVEGNGQSEIVDLIAGISNNYTGSIRMKYSGISLVPDDRIEKGMVKEFNTGENVLLRSNRYKYISKDKVTETTKEIVAKYDVRLPSLNAPLESLSGGNQQKVIFGREIELDNKIMVFVHPTRGVDINATAYIHKIILEQRNKGKAVLLITSDFDEALKLSDKIGIIYKGMIGKEFLRTDFDENTIKRNSVLQKIGKAMIGVNID
jgi:general nucleoside transport system ATP-binding protein